MKQKIKNIILQAAADAHKNGLLPSAIFPPADVEAPKTEAHGDFSTNIAMVMASVQNRLIKKPPRKIAEAILAHLKDPDRLIAKTEIAGPGFINFFINISAWHPVLNEIHEADGRYGASAIGNGKKIQVEFVSANPTGPLHVGHGRGAAVGDSVANILSFCGYDVQREYYINDSGRQINTLGRSVFLRCKELSGQKTDFPEDCYQGDYIRDIAAKVREQKGDALLAQEESQAIAHCARLAADDILAGIRQDLADFGVSFDRWYSEQSLFDAGVVTAVIEDFRKRETIYEKDGALWFRTSDYGDEKDRVVVRSNGQTTYFASDIAYHQDKFRRGFDRVVDVWGADHHGYIPRMSASVQASGHSKEQFHVILVHLVNLLRAGQPVAMSTRSGEFVTLQDVVNEVGKDAARFIFLTRHYESPLDFDLELAKQKSNDNPVYYVQYVHARISSIIAKGEERGIRISEMLKNSKLSETLPLLKEAEEIQLMKTLVRYPEVVETAGQFMEPHRITYFLMSLATEFHAYYNKHKVLADDPLLSAGRLYLVLAIQKVIRNGLRLLGVSAPEKM
jgi:arginyl-tRNA synthetase